MRSFDLTSMLAAACVCMPFVAFAQAPSGGAALIDPAKRPKTVDTTALYGLDMGKVTRGVYEIVDADGRGSVTA